MRVDALLELLDREQQVVPVAEFVDAALAAGDSDRLIRIPGHAVLREDAESHGYQTRSITPKATFVEASTRELAEFYAHPPGWLRAVLETINLASGGDQVAGT